MRLGTDEGIRSRLSSLRKRVGYMALSDDDRKEVIGYMSEAVKEGLKAFRSEVEEEKAKADAAQPPKDVKNDDTNGGPFDLAGFILGRK
jgi:hypothetical protein